MSISGIRVQIHKALNPNADTKTINIPLAPVVKAVVNAVPVNEGHGSPDHTD